MQQQDGRTAAALDEMKARPVRGDVPVLPGPWFMNGPIGINDRHAYAAGEGPVAAAPRS